jgi:tetratricopeptide (TPR) repeat protein
MLIRKPCLSVSLFPFALLLVASTALAQDRSADQSGIRGNRAEIAVTIKEGSSQLIGPLVTVKLYYLGTLRGQMTTSKGRAVFILDRLGDYTITADAIGYRSAQKEISVPVAVEAEEEIILQRDSSPEALGAAARPLLAPKAREAVDKALQALNDNKLDQAEKALDAAAKLAPNHPDVLYLQGVVFLHRNQADKAQAVLEKATQIDPKNAHAFSALGMALTNQGKYEEAITPLEKSLQMEAGGWETHWALGKAYYYRQQYSQALKTSQLALTESNGKAPQIELLVAQSLTAVGRYDDAAQTLREFLKSHGDRPEAATARRWLAGLAKNGKIQQN